jgi:hypothetical protein
VSWIKDGRGVWLGGVKGEEGYLYLEPDTAIMVKVVSGTDPVEMSSAEARELAALLNALADELDDQDAT